MTPDGDSVDFRIVDGDDEETGFELVGDSPGVNLVPVDESWALVLRE